MAQEPPRRRAATYTLAAGWLAVAIRKAARQRLLGGCAELARAAAGWLKLPQSTADRPCPWGSSGVEAAQRCRGVMSDPLIQYNLNAELPDPSETNNPDFAGLFPGAKKYKV